MSAWRLLLLLATLLALLLTELPQLATPLLGLRSLAPPPAHCPQAQHLGAWGPFVDPCLLPVLDAHDSSIRSPLTSHEGNGGSDIAQFLYAERDNGAFFFDEQGPVCLVRAFFAAGFGSLGSGDNAPNIPTARLKVEVDGAFVLNSSIEELFMSRPWGGASTFLPDFAAAAAADAAAEQAALAALPRTHAFALERQPGGTLHSGWVLQAPICATQRLRASLTYPGFKHHFWSPEALLQESVACTATFEKCPVAQYFNVNARHFPGAALPAAWAPFVPRAPAPAPPAALALAGLPAHPRDIWSAARVLRAARAAPSGARHTHISATLQRGAAGGVTLLSSPPGAGAGVVTSLALDFPTARWLLHSRHVRLRAVWDMSLEEGVARLARDSARRGAEAAAPPQPPGHPEPFTARGWADAEGDGGVDAGKAAPVVQQQGGVLEVDLQALLGPARMGRDGVRCWMPHQATTQNCRKELYLLGEFPPSPSGASGASGGVEAEGGIYITLPMPFWRSARIDVLWDAAGAGEGDGEGEGEGESLMDSSEAQAAATQVPLTAHLTLSPASHMPYPVGTAGYLQGSVRAFSMAEGMRGNILAQETGVRGSLVLLSVHVRAASQNFVEGDLRIWTDGSPTPDVWESGWEDYFNGSHGYDEDHHHCGEALFSYDRVDPVGWGCYNNTDTTVHLYQTRLLLGDSVPFLHGFRVAVEGLPGGKSAGTVRCAALWYARGAPPLRSLGWLHPPALYSTPQAVRRVEAGWVGHPALALPLGGPATYAIVAAEDAVVAYDLTSALPSYGEWRRIVELKCFKKRQCHHEGSEHGVVLAVQGALAVASGWVALRLPASPACHSILLRRLVDVRYTPQRAELWVNGQRSGRLGSSDRDALHMHTSWKVETVRLPRALTAGASSLHIVLRILPEAVEGRHHADYTAINREAGGHWSEVRWEALCVLPLQEDLG